MIRVLHIIPGRLFGGVESTLLTIARFREVCAAMHTELAFCVQGRLSDEMNGLGVRVHKLGLVRVRYPFTIWRARRVLRELLRRERFDIVLCHMPWVLAIFGSVVRAEGVSLAFGVHNPWDGDHWIERWAARKRPDVLICVSRFLAGDISKTYPRVPTEIIYNPSGRVKRQSESERQTVRRQVGTAPDAVIIAQVSRMQQGKGHRICLEALGRLRKIPSWECWQIGGPQSPAEIKFFQGLHLQAAQLGIAERVRFWGSRADVAHLLGAADIYCQPNDTFREGLGNTFVEAMRAGLPVITTAIGAAPEVVDESCGVLLAPGDVSATAATLENLILDPVARARLASGGTRRADVLFAPEVQIPRLYEALVRTISRTQLRTESVNSPEDTLGATNL
jgi:glycosyltransferase involved in cell wall biosynthesis